MMILIPFLILLLLFVLLQIRIGAEVIYSQNGVEVSAKIAGKLIRILPRPPKTRTQLAKDEEKAKKKQAAKEKKAAKKEEKKKNKKPGKKQPKPEVPLKEKIGGTVDLVLALLPIVVQALGALKRRIRISPLEIHFVAGCEDAADTAMLYAKSAGAAGIILPLFEENFDVRQREVTVDMDFLSGKSTVYIRAGLSIKIGQILYLAIRYGLACLKVFLQKRKQAKAAKAGTKEKQDKAPAQAGTEDNPEKNNK